MPNRNMAVGIFVLVGVVMFAAGLLLIGNRNKMFEKHTLYYAQFTNVSGLIKGAKVRVAGMEGGQVTGIGVPNSPNGRFRVEMEVQSKLRGLIRTDSITSIEKEGIVGDTYLLIHTGSADADLAGDHSTLPGKDPFDMSALLEKGSNLVGDADSTIKQAKLTITQVGSDLHHTLGGVNTTVGNANDVIAGVKQGRGAVGMLLRSKPFQDEVRQTMDNAKNATGSLSDASARVDTMVSDLEKRKLTQKVDDTMNSARSAAAQLDATSKQLHETLAEATAPDNSGVTTGQNLNETLASINSASANLNDDTEALKHEFLFRGFFKKRGYYVLNEQMPDTYRHDKLVTSTHNHRLWLQAGSLFETLPDGTERLTPQGKTALVEAYSSADGEFVNEPFLVEGYAQQGTAADRIMLSRQRALLTSHYLAKHFQLNPANVGSVGLNGLAPDGVHPREWDGICLVVLARGTDK